jgi:hypothetical protein
VRAHNVTLKSSHHTVSLTSLSLRTSFVSTRFCFSLTFLSTCRTHHIPAHTTRMHTTHLGLFEVLFRVKQLRTRDHNRSPTLAHLSVELVFGRLRLNAIDRLDLRACPSAQLHRNTAQSHAPPV